MFVDPEYFSIRFGNTGWYENGDFAAGRRIGPAEEMQDDSRTRPAPVS